MTRIRIETDADLAIGAQELARLEPRFRVVTDTISQLPLRRKPEGFETLLNTIVGQQVSTAAASAIWQRLEDAGLTDEHAVDCAQPEELQACGLSRPKVRFALGLARAGFDWQALAKLDEIEILARLMRLPGVGRWTAEVYALQALGLPDIMPGGDLAVQEGAKLVFNLNERPSEQELREMAKAWAPWRSIAARALWAYYGRVKKREGIR